MPTSFTEDRRATPNLLWSSWLLLPQFSISSLLSSQSATESHTQLAMMQTEWPQSNSSGEQVKDPEITHNALWMVENVQFYKIVRYSRLTSANIHLCQNVCKLNYVSVLYKNKKHFSLSDSRYTSCAIRFFSEPVPQLRDSWDNTWCYRKPRRYRFPPCKASNLIIKNMFFLIKLWKFQIISFCHSRENIENAFNVEFLFSDDHNLI